MLVKLSLPVIVTPWILVTGVPVTIPESDVFNSKHTKTDKEMYITQNNMTYKFSVW